MLKVALWGSGRKTSQISMMLSHRSQPIRRLGSVSLVRTDGDGHGEGEGVVGKI